MKIIPFNNLVLVEPIAKQDEVKAGGIILPEKHVGRYIKYKVLAVGGTVIGIKVGDTVLGNPKPENEVVNKEGHKLINSHDLFARIIEE